MKAEFQGWVCDGNDAGNSASESSLRNRFRATLLRFNSSLKSGLLCTKKTPSPLFRHYNKIN